MPTNRDYYDVLEVSRSASADQIKKSYRNLAKRYHPDMNPGDKRAEEKFKEILEAYEVLSDTEKKSTYDMFGASGFHRGAGNSRSRGFQGSPGVEFGFGGFDGIEDIFEDLFGQMGRGRRQRRQQKPRRGKDSEHTLVIDFDTAIKGGFRDITITKESRGVTQGVETIRVKIPEGVHEGSRIRISGKGQPGMANGTAGDLYLKVKVRPHPLFNRKKDDIYIDLPITIYEAIIGAKISVPTIDGRTAVVNIPSGIKNGVKLRLKGKGSPNPKTGIRGDQYVVVNITMPQKLNEESKKKIKELAESNPYNPRLHIDSYIK